MFGAPCKALSVSDLTVFRVAETITLKSAKVLSYSDLRVTLNDQRHSPVRVSAATSCPLLCQTSGIIFRCRPSWVTVILRHSRSCHHAEAWHQYLKSTCRKRKTSLRRDWSYILSINLVLEIVAESYCRFDAETELYS